MHSAAILKWMYVYTGLHTGFFSGGGTVKSVWHHAHNKYLNYIPVHCKHSTSCRCQLVVTLAYK